MAAAYYAAAAAPSYRRLLRRAKTALDFAAGRIISLRSYLAARRRVAQAASIASRLVGSGGARASTRGVDRGAYSDYSVRL
jgi:hypothetical protein